MLQHLVSVAHKGKGTLCMLPLWIKLWSEYSFWCFKSGYEKLKIKKYQNNKYKNVIEEDLAKNKKETVINLLEM